MKRLFFITLLLIGAFTIKGQTGQNQPASQNITSTATLKVSSRLFATKDDMTSVILIIPVDSVVSVIDSDSTYLHVVYDDNEGYIFRRDATIDQTPVAPQQNIQQQSAAENNEPVQNQQQGRFSYLDNKYGSTLALKLFAGKIWKGMDTDMVKDSWGTAEKVNRSVSGNTVKEEWIYRNTWLYFENNVLREWGPVKN